MVMFLMFVWSFIIRAIPFKKIFTGVACMIILITGMILVNNYNMKGSDSVVFTNSSK